MTRPSIHPRRPLAEALESRTLLDAELAVDLNPATFGSSPGGFVTLGDGTCFFTSRRVEALRRAGRCFGTVCDRADLVTLGRIERGRIRFVRVAASSARSIT